MLSKTLLPVIALLALTPVAYALQDAGGGYRAAPPPPPPQADASPSAALKAFKIGYEEYQMTAELQKASVGATGEKAKSSQEAVTGGYTRARDKFRVAVAADANMKEGWNMLGFTSRMLGEYDDSMKAYEKALTLDPNYPEAIEYRAELFLLLGRLPQAKDAYATLLKSAPPIAGALKTSMKDWVKAKKPVQGLSDADRAEFTAWVAKL